MEKQARTIFKTVSWRIIATSTTLIMVYVFTNNLVLSASVGVSETLAKTILYYLHERTWNKSDFGRKITYIPPSKATLFLKNVEAEKEKNV